MKIATVGLWHLGSVISACAAKHFNVIGLDFDNDTINKFKQGKAPLFEPGLDELIQKGLDSKQLDFTTDPAVACKNADILWCSSDTPVNDDDESDLDFVLNKVYKALEHLTPGALVLISAQMPVGTCRKLEAAFPQFHFACSPENLRLGKSLDSFEKPERIIVGIRDNIKKALLEELFKPFSQNIIFMRTESAEMVKHSLNAFLSLSITFINEIARLCEHVGADAKEVSIGLKTEPRIGSKAYLGPGGPFAGGTLARDVVSLTKIGLSNNETLSIIPAIKQSNDLHRNWTFNRLQAKFGDLRGQVIAILGLVYTVNTNTLRRSSAIELCKQLLAAGAIVRAFDPAIKELPSELPISLSLDIEQVTNNVDAIVVCTEWPEFRNANWDKILPNMNKKVIIDANRFLEKELAKNGSEYFSVGRLQ